MSSEAADFRGGNTFFFIKVSHRRKNIKKLIINIRMINCFINRFFAHTCLQNLRFFHHFAFVIAFFCFFAHRAIITNMKKEKRFSQLADRRTAAGKSFKEWQTASRKRLESTWLHPGAEGAPRWNNFNHSAPSHPSLRPVAPHRANRDSRSK